MKHGLTYFLLAVSVLILASCVELGQRENGTIIAEVGSVYLTLEEVKARVPEELFKTDSLGVIERYRNNWVKKQLLAKEARRLGLTSSEEVQRNLRQAETEVLTQAMINQILIDADREPVTRQEAQAYYENYKDQFVLNERHVRFRHVITETVQESRNAKAALQRGRTWEVVAQQYAINPEETLRNANLFYPISIAAIDYSFMHDYLKIIGITEISPIRRIGDHFHFVQLMEDRSAGDHPEMDWILDQIEEWLRLDRKQRRINSFERNLLLQAESNNEIRLHDVFHDMAAN